MEQEPAILVVDDAQDICDLIEYSLKQAGYRHVDTASSGQEAVALCRECAPALIVPDLVFVGPRQGSRQADRLRPRRRRLHHQAVQSPRARVPLWKIETVLGENNRRVWFWDRGVRRADRPLPWHRGGDLRDGWRAASNPDRLKRHSVRLDVRPACSLRLWPRDACALRADCLYIVAVGPGGKSVCDFACAGGLLVHSSVYRAYGR